MATAAYLDGRKASYVYGIAKANNPYRKGWVRIGLTGIGDQLTAAEDWDRGHDEGVLLGNGSFGELMTALDKLGTLVKQKRWVSCESC